MMRLPRAADAMSYENAIQTYNRLYKKTDLATIRELWAGNTGTLNVYVHSPFCASVCKFCYYKGVEFSWKTDAPVYERFYREYLPSVVAPFREMLEARPIANYFFGGGTPSLMRPDTLRDVLGLFPGLPGVRSKTFEIHPALWSPEQLDILAAAGFNCCIIGIQSFDPRVLERQHRIHAPFAKVHELAKHIKSRGMHLAVDLIYRMDDLEADAIFEQDLDLVAHLDSDVISLQLNYDQVKNDAHTERFFGLIAASRLPSHYYWEGGEQISVNQKKMLKCFRYVRNGIPPWVYAQEIFPFTETIDEASKIAGHDAGYPSVIGFGSYRNPRKNTFSNVRDGDRRVEYIEVNNDWVPEYFITYESEARDFFDEAIKQLEVLRTIGPPPKGVTIQFANKTGSSRENQIYRTIETPVDVSVSWAFYDEAVAAYSEKLREAFPHWKWWTKPK
jgi:hypothetical protein